MKFAGFIRSSLLGDVVMSLPIINVLKEIYKSDPEITVILAKKCKQIAPLLLFQNGISKIQLTQGEEKLNEDEIHFLRQDHDLFVSPTPSHPREQDWYNYRNCIDETILMCGEEYYEVFKSLPKELQQPRLNPWWVQDKPKPKYERKHIAIFPFAGYSQGSQRSPSKKWWLEIIKDLGSRGYFINHFGHFNEPYLSPEPIWFDEDSNLCYYKYQCYLPLFTQIQLANECDLVIGTDSGSGWICGALGMNQISLLTRWENNHKFNDFALAPENWAGKNINLFSEDSCSNIPISKVLELIK